MNRSALSAALFVALGAGGPARAHSLVESSAGEPAFAASFSFSGSLEEDVRAGFPERGGVFVERARSAAAVRAEAKPARDVRAVLDARFLWLGDSRDASQAQLSDAAARDPYRIDADALFVEADRLAGTRVRLRAGRQTIRWGSGLLFNPTSLVNPPDLEDPLRYGAPLGTEMIRLEWLGPVHVDAIAVPRFRPALLPVVSPRNALASSGIPAAVALARDPAWSIDVGSLATSPPPTADDAQGALRLSAKIPVVDIDASLTGYAGRTPIPQLRSADLTADFAAKTLTGTATFDYPRVAAGGADLATQIPLGSLGDVGAWFEGAWIVPTPMRRDVIANGVTTTTREFEDPYLRVATGIDRTTAAGLYVNLQFVRGFPEEFGKQSQGNYAVGVFDLPLFRERVHARLVAACELGRGNRTSGLLSPEIAWSREALTISLGGFGGIGTDDTKFGGPLTGPATAFGRARVSF